MKKIVKNASLIAALSTLSACATIIQSSNDTVSVNTFPASRANCSLSNERGSYNVYAPASVVVKRSRSDLNIQCSDTYTGASGKTVLESDAEAWAFTNIFWGLLSPIAIGVDWMTGAAYTYPDSVNVTLAGAPTYAPTPPETQGYAPSPAPQYNYTPGYVPAPAAAALQYYAPAPAAPATVTIVPNPQPVYAPPATTRQ